MKRWSWHRTRVLLLAVLLGLGMSLSFVQGSMMAMAVAADGVHPESNGCQGCGGNDHNHMNAGTCVTVCASAAQGLISEELLPPPSASRTPLHIDQVLLSGQSHRPDHGPPKILTLS
jgi:hypothetical protein